MKHTDTAEAAYSVNRAHGLMALTAITILAAAPASAGVSFTFNYTDQAGVGFNADGQTGIDRKAGLQRAADYVSSFFTAYSANVVLDVDGSQTDDFTLASAGSHYSSPNPGTGFADRGDVMLKILGQADPDPGYADGSIDWNFEDFDWSTGDTFNPGELDMISTAIHEITHVLGFSSGIQQSGEDYWGSTIGTSSTWSPFDRFVGDISGVLINEDAELNLTRWLNASEGGTGEDGLYFYGENAMAANGGNPVFLYSPTLWEDGSSGSHLDTDFYTDEDFQIMNHTGSVYDGLDIREYSAIEIGILRDIGYTLLIPEPSACLLSALGFSALLLRRRR